MPPLFPLIMGPILDLANRDPGRPMGRISVQTILPTLLCPYDH